MSIEAMMDAEYGPEHCSAGHRWKLTGGRACNCLDGRCSLPVHECEICGVCDYGDNEDAQDVLMDCRVKNGEVVG